MSTIPNDRRERVQFYRNHIAPWSSHAAAVGLSAGQVTNLTTLVAAAEDAMAAAEAARQASKAATEAFYNAVSSMSTDGAALVKTIRAFAEATSDPNVYVLAEIPAPSGGSAVPPPGTPANFTVTLNQDGSLRLAWKCQNPKNSSGTIYEVRRRALGSMGPWQYAGASGTRSFIDDTIVAPTAGVSYQITAIRSTQRGTPAVYNVAFGAGGAGLFIASVTQDTGKLAA